MNHRISIGIFICLIALNIIVWSQVFFHTPPSDSRLYFFDVGQGDSSLLVLPHGIKVIIDAGPDKKITNEIELGLGRGARYIDLAVISHPEFDHFNGFHSLLDSYRIGAFLINGRGGNGAAWENLLEKIKEKNIPIVHIGARDSIHFGENLISVIAPAPEHLQSAELNDTGIVIFASTTQFTALFAADISSVIENFLLKNYHIKADILKIAHHGSKYSSSPDFLNAVNPKIALIGAGVSNSYGHPAPETIERLEAAQIPIILSTNEDGTILIQSSRERTLQAFRGL